ncbi:Ig-like domain repeat protein [Streptomyces sp. NPDC086549]|uniref:Ig-like domain repeat protein n=1 Tax=Streptomyces sp. NPDC086549 TaxID=3365752 RepID=UPI003825E4FB
MRKRTLTAATTLAVLISSAALTATPAFADTTTALPVKSVGDVVVDGEHQRVFISDPDNGKIVVTDYNGQVIKQLTSLQGVTDLELSADSDTLYAAVYAGGPPAVVEIATASATQVGHVDLPYSPKYLAEANGKLWFGYAPGANQGGIGSIDLAAAGQPASFFPDEDWTAAPMVDAAGNTLVAGQPGRSPQHLAAYDVSSGTPTRTALRDADGGGMKELTLTPDGNDVVLASPGPNHHTVYRTSDLAPDGEYPSDNYANAVDIAPDGSVAAGIDGPYEPDIYVFKPGAHTSVREYDFRTTDRLADGALAWAPDASRLFAVSYNSDGAYSLRVLAGPTKAVTTVTVSAPSSAARAKKLTVTGKVTSKVALPAGVKLAVTRTDLDSPNGKSLATVTAKADGTYSFTDTPPAGGKVKYTVRYAGDADHAAGSAADTVDVSRAKPSLSVSNNGKVYAYGADVKFTAHLGSTYKNRTVEIWADPFGSDKPNKLVKKGTVNSSGNLSVTLDLKRDTKVTAKFAGDARYQPRSVSSTVGAKVKVSTSVSRQYKTKSTWGHTYYFFHKSKNPLFTTTMTYYPGRQQRLQFEVYYQGTWYDGGSQYFPVGSDGVSRVELGGDHGQDVGWRFRARSSYLNSSSGDTVNSTTHGAWKYFTFTS